MARVVIPGFRKIEVSGGGEGGTSNYNDLTNKPSINNVPLVGNLNTVNLKLTDSTLTEEGVPADAKTVGTKLEEQSSNLNSLSEQLGNHTVKSDVPENAVFTDTIYDDTEVKGSIDELNSNLDGLEYSEVAGGKNLWSIGDIKVSGNVATEVLISDIFKSNTQYTIKLKTKSFTTSDIGHFEFIYTDGTKTIISWDKTIGGAYATTSDYGKTIDILQWTGWNAEIGRAHV